MKMGTIISYLYEDSPLDVHKNKLYCSACNKKLLLDSIEVENSERSKYKYCYTPWMKIEDKHTEFQLKKIFFYCPKCNKKYSTNEAKRLKYKQPIGILKYFL